MLDMIYFDTLKYVETLEATGIPEAHAKVLSKGQQMAMSEYRERVFLEELATKADIDRLELATRADIDRLRISTQAEIHRLKIDFDKLTVITNRLEVDVIDLKADMRLLKWMVGFSLTGIMGLMTGMIIMFLQHF